MAEWLRLPSGQAVNMDRVVQVTTMDEVTTTGDAQQLVLCTVDGALIKLRGTDSEAVRAYLERVHVGERTADEKPPRGRDHFIRKT